MSDLLNKLGKQPATKGSEIVSEPSSAPLNTANNFDVDRGGDLLSKAALGQDNASAKAQSTPNASEVSKPSEAAVETASKQDEGWTSDSALKEVKKLREENKAYRIKYQEQLEQVRIETEARIKAKEQEFESLKHAQAELDRIKAEQEDKKRDIAEKLAHREAKLAEMQNLVIEKEKGYQSLLAQKESELANFKAQADAEAQVYKNRLDEELGKIPEKFKDYASLLVKGVGDSREALTVVMEAKLKGMFDDKLTIVNHSVPNAYDGARSTKERLETVEKEKRASMNSSQKIGEALKQIKSGNSNSVFRTK